MTLIKPGDPYSPDPSAVTQQEALKIIEGMSRMEAAMGDFELKFGTDSFYCVIDALFNSMPPEMVLRVERVRYHARRIKRGEKN
jgi:hypothetical protein